MRLSNTTLRRVAPPVGRPTYDRGSLTPGIVHLGLGAFFRAHGAVAIEDCLEAGHSDWGIVAASLRGPKVRDALAPQDGLYTLSIRDAAETRERVIGAIGRVIAAPEDPPALLAALADPRIRIVTLTVTEKGYGVDPASGALQRDRPDVAHDLATPDRPRTALGFLSEALRLRRHAGTPPFTVLSCDNLSSNGATLRRALVAFASARDSDLARFIETAVACPCSVVDRIVPATTADDRAAVEARLGLEDACPVVGESFFQWVVEDRFPAGRPPLEDAGVRFVGDVAPYERMKLRLLSGAHSAIAAIGRLAGLATVAETVDEPSVRRFLDLYWDEVAATLALSASEVEGYTSLLLRRFGNRALPHRTAQIAVDALLKLPPRILDPLRERLEAGAPAPAMIFAVAAVVRSCGGRDDHGRSLKTDDAILQAWANRPDQSRASASDIARAFLARETIFGQILPRNPLFVEALVGFLDAIARRGVIHALEPLIDPDPSDGL